MSPTGRRSHYNYKNYKIVKEVEHKTCNKYLKAVFRDYRKIQDAVKLLKIQTIKSKIFGSRSLKPFANKRHDGWMG